MILLGNFVFFIDSQSGHFTEVIKISKKNENELLDRVYTEKVMNDEIPEVESELKFKHNVFSDEKKICPDCDQLYHVRSTYYSLVFQAYIGQFTCGCEGSFTEFLLPKCGCGKPAMEVLYEADSKEAAIVCGGCALSLIEPNEDFGPF